LGETHSFEEATAQAPGSFDSHTDPSSNILYILFAKNNLHSLIELQ